MVAAPNFQPIFIVEPINTSVLLTTQATTRAGGSITPAEFVTAGASGALIETIYAIPLSNEVVNVLRLFVATDSGYDIILEHDLAVVTGIDNDAAVTRTEVTLPDILFPEGAQGLRLAPGQVLYASLGVTASGSGWKVTAIGGQYEVSDTE